MVRLFSKRFANAGGSQSKSASGEKWGGCTRKGKGGGGGYKKKEEGVYESYIDFGVWVEALSIGWYRRKGGEVPAKIRQKVRTREGVDPPGWANKKQEKGM